MVRGKSIPTKAPTKKTPRHTLLYIGRKEYKIRWKLLKVINKLQRSTKQCMLKGPFYNLIREILQQTSGRHIGMRIQKTALEALHEAAELYMVELFELANLLATHAKRITLRCVDIQMVQTIRGVSDPGYKY